MIPLPPKVKLYVGVLLAGLLAAGGYWDKALLDAGLAVPAWLPPILAALVFLEGFVTVPPAAAQKLAAALTKITDLTAKMGGMSAVLFLAGFLATSETGCKGANFPSLDKVETVVLDDLMSCGTSTQCEAQMVSDVTTLIAQGALGPNVGKDAVVLVKDALQVLADAGIIPQNVVPKAKAILAIEKIKLSGE